MKSVIAATVLSAILLSACNKPAEQPVEERTDVSAIAAPVEQAPVAPEPAATESAPTAEISAVAAEPAAEDHEPVAEQAEAEKPAH